MNSVEMLKALLFKAGVKRDRITKAQDQVHMSQRIIWLSQQYRHTSNQPVREQTWYQEKSRTNQAQASIKPTTRL
jgi:hypothetical protein